MKRMILLLLALASPAAADVCDDWWFTRNAVFNQAGYCFGSTLGKALFDNSDCTGKSINLSPEDQALVDRVMSYEAQYECKIDTSATTLQMYDLSFRLQLRDQPFRDEFESGCLGWKGVNYPLLSGHDPYAPPVGQVETGDYVLFSHWDVGEWTYVTTHPQHASGVKSAGWAPRGIFTQDACNGWAG